MKPLLAGLVVLLCALQYRLWFGEGSVQEVWRLREESRATRAELVRLSGRNRALAAEVADLKSGLDAVEERARSDLGMIDADEVFYQFVREGAAGRSASAAPDSAPGTAEHGASGDAPRAVVPDEDGGARIRDEG